MRVISRFDLFVLRCVARDWLLANLEDPEKIVRVTTVRAALVNTRDPQDEAEEPKKA